MVLEKTLESPLDCKEIKPVNPKGSKNITLSTNVRLVKAMVFPVVVYGCESWTIKLSAKELMLLNCGVGEDS